MSEPIIERLSRFTPNVGGLDRDSLLYAAGQASARPNRTWIALAAVLAATQTLTLALWWSRPAPTLAHLPPPTPRPTAPVPPEPPSESSGDPGQWSVRHRLLESEPENYTAPASTGTFVESGPPLRAFASPSLSILN